jgi:hypothetical protein
MGNGGAAPRILNPVLDGAGGQLHAPGLYASGKEAPTQCIGGREGPTAGLGTVTKARLLPHCNLQPSFPPSHSAIPTRKTKMEQVL